MIDESDGDMFWLVSLTGGGPVMLVLFVVAVVLWVIAAGNSEECGQRHCDSGRPKVVNHECVCVGVAR